MGMWAIYHNPSAEVESGIPGHRAKTQLHIPRHSPTDKEKPRENQPNVGGIIRINRERSLPAGGQQKLQHRTTLSSALGISIDQNVISSGNTPLFRHKEAFQFAGGTGPKSLCLNMGRGIPGRIRWVALDGGVANSVLRYKAQAR